MRAGEAWLGRGMKHTASCKNRRGFVVIPRDELAEGGRANLRYVFCNLKKFKEG
jgi:hypothetical protein